MGGDCSQRDPDPNLTTHHLLRWGDYNNGSVAKSSLYNTLFSSHMMKIQSDSFRAGGHTRLYQSAALNHFPFFAVKKRVERDTLCFFLYKVERDLFFLTQRKPRLLVDGPARKKGPGLGSRPPVQPIVLRRSWLLGGAEEKRASEGSSDGGGGAAGDRREGVGEPGEGDECAAAGLVRGAVVPVVGAAGRDRRAGGPQVLPPRRQLRHVLHHVGLEGGALQARRHALPAHHRRPPPPHLRRGGPPHPRARAVRPGCRGGTCSPNNIMNSSPMLVVELQNRSRVVFHRVANTVSIDLT